MDELWPFRRLADSGKEAVGSGQWAGPPGLGRSPETGSGFPEVLLVRSKWEKLDCRAWSSDSCPELGFRVLGEDRDWQA